MEKSHKVVAGIIAAAGLGLAVASAYADPQGMGAGTGPHAMGGMQHGTTGAMGLGAMGTGAMGTGAMGHGAAGQGAGAGPTALTPEEHTALAQKMRNAKTPEERQQIAAATRAEMQKRAQAKEATHPEHRGMGAGMGHTHSNTNESNSH